MSPLTRVPPKVAYFLRGTQPHLYQQKRGLIDLQHPHLFNERPGLHEGHHLRRWRHRRLYRLFPQSKKRRRYRRRGHRGGQRRLGQIGRIPSSEIGALWLLSVTRSLQRRFLRYTPAPDLR